MKPTPGTQAREQWDADHGGIDGAQAGSDEVAVAYRCPERVEGNATCMQCGHARTPHGYCPHMEHYCERLKRFVSCVEVTA